MLDAWAIDPEITYLNHGTVGAPPRRVLATQQRIRDEIERHPSKFLLRELTGIGVGAPRAQKPRMRAAADAVGEFLGARGDDIVFVDNVTAGINAVLRSFDFRADDEILIGSLAYGAIVNAARYAARERGAHVRVVELPYPATSSAAIADAYIGAIGPRTRMAIVDHITSESALIFPLAQIAAACRARGVAVLADGAHAPGAIALDIPALGVDWYSANLHKWLYTPRSCGILWAAPERQQGLHPTVISWGLDQGFAAEFDLVGTRDPSPHLAAPDGIAFLRELGADAVRAYNHDLVWEAARFLSARWGAALGVPESMIGTMATFALPAQLGASAADAARLRDALLFEDRIEAQIHAARGGLWVRLSAQVYNEMSDYARLGDVIVARA
ncbi:MAG: aminotransferase class V-fold PLP-dependent enzyme [bacterium]